MSEEFWDAAAPLLAEGLIDEGTIMGGPCVRSGGEFVGMPHHRGPGIVVKVPRERVDELVEAGDGKPFAPAGRVFKEWVLVEAHDEDRWRDLLRESVAFVNPAVL
jgi:hypothetical protein